MEYPEPTIDIEDELQILLGNGSLDRELAVAEALASDPASYRRPRERIRSLLAQAWDEGRWSPPGACANPYGDAPPQEPLFVRGALPGAPLQRLRAAAKAALDWVENMSPTTGRTALATQLRDALGGK